MATFNQIYETINNVTYKCSKVSWNILKIMHGSMHTLIGWYSLFCFDLNDNLRQNDY